MPVWKSRNVLAASVRHAGEAGDAGLVVGVERVRAGCGVRVVHVLLLSTVIGRLIQGAQRRLLSDVARRFALVAAMTMCPRCGSTFLQPLRCEAKGSDVVVVELRCPDCMTWLKAPHTRADMRELDRRRRSSGPRSSRQYEQLGGREHGGAGRLLGPRAGAGSRRRRRLRVHAGTRRPIRPQMISAMPPSASEGAADDRDDAAEDARAAGRHDVGVGRRAARRAMSIVARGRVEAPDGRGAAERDATSPWRAPLKRAPLEVWQPRRAITLLARVVAERAAEDHVDRVALAAGGLEAGRLARAARARRRRPRCRRGR